MRKILLLAVLTIIGAPGALYAAPAPTVTDGGTLSETCQKVSGSTVLFMEDTSLVPQVTAGSNGCTSTSTVGYYSRFGNGSSSTNYKKSTLTTYRNFK